MVNGHCQGRSQLGATDANAPARLSEAPREPLFGVAVASEVSCSELGSLKVSGAHNYDPFPSLAPMKQDGVQNQ